MAVAKIYNSQTGQWEAAITGPSGVVDVTSPITNTGTPTEANIGIDGYVFRQTVYFTSSGTFSKDSYPWLKAIRVKCQGAGGGGANKSGSYEPAAGGGGGSYAESFITDIASLPSSVTVTVGAGGDGGVIDSNADGVDGGNSLFGSIVLGEGGTRASFTQYLGGDANGGTGDIVFSGSDGQSVGTATETGGGSGGSSHLGGGGRGGRGAFTSQHQGQPGNLYGGGGGGSSNNAGGGSGADGIVILELFA